MMKGKREKHITTCLVKVSPDSWRLLSSARHYYSGNCLYYHLTVLLVMTCCQANMTTPRCTTFFYMFCYMVVLSKLWQFKHKILSVSINLTFCPQGYIALVMLPSLSEVNETFTGKRSLISGWGKTGDEEDPSQTLQYTDVTVIPNSVCEMDYKPGFIRESTLCAGNKNKGICSGDHGAPLVLKGSFKQIGIASFYYDKCEVPVPAGYTRVTYFLNWITRTAGIDID
ncbi:collagenase-like [Schistocerca gregaria]|uniref:collagenase-like n=1 Tax=Schistocerca gregaria TaxID=7010 RepID=UPI00211DD0E6|nr:collagenase-like [Schistocerca gregaria]